MAAAMFFGQIYEWVHCTAEEPNTELEKDFEVDLAGLRTKVERALALVAQGLGGPRP